MLLKSFVFYNFLILFYMLVLLFIALLVIYPFHRFCLHKLRTKYLDAALIDKVEKIDTSVSYFRFGITSPMHALKEGMLFFPEMIVSVIMALITLCVIEVGFHFFALDPTVFITGNFEAIIFAILITIALYMQLKWLHKRFINHQLSLREQLVNAGASEKYILQRMMYDSVFNIAIFSLGFMLWLPFIMMAMIAPNYQLLVIEFGTWICLFLAVFAIVARRMK